MQWNDSLCTFCVLEVKEKGGMPVVNGCLLGAAKEVYPDKEIRFINVRLCAWIFRCVKNWTNLYEQLTLKVMITNWQYMKLLTPLAIYEITGNTNSIWNYWQHWQYMKLLTTLTVYEITDTTGNIWNYWQHWQYMKLLTTLAVYEITDNTGNIWNYWQHWQYMKLLTTLARLRWWLYLFVASLISLLVRGDLFWEH